MENKERLRSNVRINELINLNKHLSDRFKIVDNMYEYTFLVSKTLKKLLTCYKTNYRKISIT